MALGIHWTSFALGLFSPGIVIGAVWLLMSLPPYHDRIWRLTRTVSLYRFGSHERSLRLRRLTPVRRDDGRTAVGSRRTGLIFGPDADVLRGQARQAARLEHWTGVVRLHNDDPDMAAVPAWILDCADVLVRADGQVISRDGDVLRAASDEELLLAQPATGRFAHPHATGHVRLA